MDYTLFLKKGETLNYSSQSFSIDDFLKSLEEKYGDKQAIISVDIDNGQECKLSYCRFVQLVRQAANYLYGTIKNLPS